jgi:hypothetical protein
VKANATLQLYKTMLSKSELPCRLMLVVLVIRSLDIVELCTKHGREYSRGEGAL